MLIFLWTGYVTFSYVFSFCFTPVEFAVCASNPRFKGVRSGLHCVFYFRSFIISYNYTVKYDTNE